MQHATLKYGGAWASTITLVGSGLVMICLAIWPASGQPAPPKLKATEAYHKARVQRSVHPEDIDHAWILGRACFDLAEFATNNIERAALAREGIQACQAALTLSSTSAPAHYYLGMNRGQLARTMTLGALKLVSAMEEDFLKAQSLDPSFDEAGPDRNLGLLYQQAPGWPVSLGNQTKARKRLEKAVKLAPLYPGNRLNLMEAYAEWGEVELLRQAYASWEKLRGQARLTYSGDRWYWDWLDWEQRLKRLEDRLRGPPKERPAKMEPEEGDSQRLALPVSPP